MTTADAPPQTDASSHEVRRLTRTHDNRMIAGVCGGVARYFDIDPVIPRVILAALAVFGGAGIVIYAAGWLLLPADGEPATRVERWLAGRHPAWLRDLAIVGGVVIVVSIALHGDRFALRLGSAIVVILLIMAAVVVFDRWPGTDALPWVRRRPPTDPATAATAAAGEPPIWYTSQTMPGAPPAAWTAPTSSWESAAAPVRPRPKRPRSVLGWLIVGATLLVVGALSLVAFSGAAHPQPADVLAAAVATVGIGLLVGSLRGRAWLMIPVGVLLVGMLGVAAAVPRNLTWSAGTRDWAPVGAGPHDTYVLGAGKATLDLSRLPSIGGTTVTGRLGAGRLIVYVPAGRDVLVDANVNAGRLYLFGHEYDGTGLHERWTLAPTSVIGPPVHLTLNAGFGDVEVRRA